ncbi:hypothetical protein [Halothiobacillus sp.]|uniref:hypothetical protein n=1 Tax=Halothiobacillus sp. TaxID=1891311 RepID=UPI002AD21936|nr:hypothetical protein [Halothiobacillus sp.]
MKTPRFLHYLILLLAVWLPLDNAVAGAVITDCPIMSHALEEGMQKTVDPADVLHGATASMISAISLHLQTAQSDQSNGCCDHCGVCLLLGGVALPSLHTGMTFTAYTANYQVALQTQAPAGVHTHPFRPPIA